MHLDGTPSLRLVILSNHSSMNDNKSHDIRYHSFRTLAGRSFKKKKTLASPHLTTQAPSIHFFHWASHWYQVAASHCTRDLTTSASISNDSTLDVTRLEHTITGGSIWQEGAQSASNSFAAHFQHSLIRADQAN